MWSEQIIFKNVFKNVKHILIARYNMIYKNNINPTNMRSLNTFYYIYVIIIHNTLYTV